MISEILQECTFIFLIFYFLGGKEGITNKILYAVRARDLTPPPWLKCSEIYASEGTSYSFYIRYKSLENGISSEDLLILRHISHIIYYHTSILNYFSVVTAFSLINPLWNSFYMILCNFLFKEAVCSCFSTFVSFFLL